MSLETALTAVRQTLNLGHPHLGVTYFGGEPLLAKDLISDLTPEIDRLCRERGVTVNFKIPTNGMLLDEEFVRFCERHAIFLSLSIDGDEAAQGDRRQADGTSSFAKTRSALRLLAARATTFATYSVVSPRTAGRLCESVQYLYEAGSRILITAIDFGADWTRRDLDALEKAYRDLAEFYVEKTLARQHFYLSAFDSKISAHTRPDLVEGAVCRIGVNQLSVMPGGEYFPCIQFVEKPEFQVGDVSRGVDLEACHALFRESACHTQACGECGIADRCSHHCACVSWQSTGTFDGVSPIACEHERVLIPIADSVARRLFRKRAPLFINKHYNPEYDLMRTLDDIVRQNTHETAGSPTP